MNKTFSLTRPYRSATMLAVLTLLTACTGPPPPEKIVIPTSTKVTDDATRELLLNYTPANGILVFSGSNEFLKGLTADNILVSEPTDKAPDGFLRKVKAVRSEGGDTIIDTEPASLIEAIDIGAVEVQRPLTIADLESSQVHVQGVSLSRRQSLEGQGGFRYEFHKAMFDGDGDETTTNDQLAVSGFLDLAPILDFSLDIKNTSVWFVKVPTGIKEFKAAVGISESSELRVVGNYDKIGKLSKEFSLATIGFKSIVIGSIGPVPIVVKPELELSIKLEGSVTATLRMQVSQDFKAQVGVHYYDKGWHNLSGLDDHFKWDKPDFSASTKARAYASARFGLALYGVAGSYFKANAYGDLDVDVRRDPLWTLRAGVTGDVGIYAKILSFKLADYNATVLDKSWELDKESGHPDISELAPSSLGLSARVNQAAAGTISFSNAGGSDLTFNTSSDQDWLGVSPASGSVAPGSGQILEVNVTCPNVAADYVGIITLSVNDPDEPNQTVEVKLHCDAFATELLFEDTFDQENNGQGAYNYTGFKNWLVRRGAVDLLGPNLESDYLCAPNHGLCIDLDGSSDKAGWLETVQSFDLSAGLYTLTFMLSGSQRSNDIDDNSDSVTVSLGTAFSERITLDSNFPASSFTRLVEVAEPTTATINFDHEGADFIGLILDDVKLFRGDVSDR